MKKTITSEAAMKQFGQQVGRMLEGGEILQLVGDIGAGKTTFTKGLALGLGIEETVQSPTFTISRVYDARDGLHLAHYDFYRLVDPGIMADELGETTADATTVVVIEWGDIVADVVGSDVLTIAIESPTETVRNIVLTARGDRSVSLLERLGEVV